MSTIDAVETVVAPLLESAGLELVDLEFESRIIRVTVDRPGGVDLDAIGSATAAISRALDLADAIPGGRYELEVSSPGLERRLRHPRHFASQIGATIAVKTKPGVDGERRIEGRLVSADDSGICIEPADLGGVSRELGYEDIDRATTVFDWRAALAGARQRQTGGVQRSAVIEETDEAADALDDIDEIDIDETDDTDEEESR